MRTAVAAIPSSSLRIPLPVAVLAFCLLWSSAYAVAKLAIADCPPLILLTTRFLLAGLLMLGLAAITGVSLKMSRRDLLLFAALGVANQAAYLGIGYVGLKTVSAGLSALVISANPVLTAVLAAIFLDETMTWRKVAGLLLGVGGVAFVVQGRLAGGADHLEGIIYTLIALVSLVIGTILFKRFAPKGGLWVGNGVQSLSAGRGDGVPRSAGVCVRLSSVVPPASGVRRNGRELVPLPDAAARHVVRVAAARRACIADRHDRHRSGRARDLSGHTSGGSERVGRALPLPYLV